MASDPARRGNVTDEHRAEAARLKAIWLRERDRLLASGVGSQEAFGQAFEIGNQAAVGFFLNGKTALSPKAAAGFAKGLRCHVADFSPRLAGLFATPAPTLSPDAQEIAELYDKLGEAGRRVLRATAHALTLPDAPGGADPSAPPAVPPTPSRAVARKTPAA